MLIKFPACTELFWDLCARMVMSYGSKHIYGEKFDNKNFIMKYVGTGILSMANTGLNTASRFSFALPGLSDWMARMCFSASLKRA